MAPNESKDPRSLSRQDFEKDVIRRAQADSAFKAQLLADPKAAIKAAYGMDLPPGVELQVFQETPSRFYLILPVEAEELTDEQLAAVAGGVGVSMEYGRTVMSWKMGPSALMLRTDDVKG